MRFRFCGELDAPDWILAEIAVLAKISSVRVKLLVGQIVSSILGQKIDFAKVQKLTADAKLEMSDTKAIVAALDFILRSAAKYDCDDGTLCNELQQLGLPKEHSEAVVRPYREKKDLMREKFVENSLSLTKLTKSDWRVDYILSSSHVVNLNQPSIQLQLTVQDPPSFVDLRRDVPPPPEDLVRRVAFTLSPAKLRVLLHELQAAKQLMENLS